MSKKKVKDCETTCAQCRARLWEVLANECKAEDAAAVHRHLAHCSSCQNEAANLQAVRALLQEDVPPMPERFAADLHRSLLSAAAEMQNASSLRRRTYLRDVWRDRLARLSRLGGLKIVVPALICLTLCLGVVSGGIYHQWLNADRVFSPIPTEGAATHEESTQSEGETPSPSNATPQDLESPDASSPDTPLSSQTPTVMSSSASSSENKTVSNPSTTRKPSATATAKNEETAENRGSSTQEDVTSPHLVESMPTGEASPSNTTEPTDAEVAHAAVPQTAAAPSAEPAVYAGIEARATRRIAEATSLGGHYQIAIHNLQDFFETYCKDAEGVVRSTEGKVQSITLTLSPSEWERFLTWAEAEGLHPILCEPIEDEEVFQLTILKDEE